MAVQPAADPAGYQRIDLSLGGVQSDLLDFHPVESMQIGGRGIDPSAPPGPLRSDPLGVIVPVWLDVRAIHRFPMPRFDCFSMPPGEIANRKLAEYQFRVARPHVYVDNPRPVLCGNGDYLLSVVAGDEHYGLKPIGWKVNDIFLYRSCDRGQTWAPPVKAPNIYNQHAWPLLRARRSGSGNRIAVIYTMPTPGDYDGGENAGIACRYSDDHGYTWSTPTRIRPTNDPGFQGMWCIQPTETASGAWLFAPHVGHWQQLEPTLKVTSALYAMRCEDQGENWQVYPGPRPAGWKWKPADRMDEGRPIALADGTILLFARTEEGHVWKLRGSDDGRAWGEPRATALVHPDAPPMISTLSDGQTLIALHHNRFEGRGFGGCRGELWASLSRDAGETWTEPRFLIATSTYALRPISNNKVSNVTYCDTLADRGMLHIFVPHNWRQVLHIRLAESELDRLPIAAEIGTQRMGR